MITAQSAVEVYAWVIWGVGIALVVATAYRAGKN